MPPKPQLSSRLWEESGGRQKPSLPHTSHCLSGQQAGSVFLLVTDSPQPCISVVVWEWIIITTPVAAVTAHLLSAYYEPHTQNPLHAFSDLILKATLGVGAVIMSITQMRKMRPGRVSYLKARGQEAEGLRSRAVGHSWAPLLNHHAALSVVLNVPETEIRETEWLSQGHLAGWWQM